MAAVVSGALAVLAFSLASAGVLATGEGEARPALRYRVRADAAVQHLRVEVCFDGAAPEALVPGIDAAASALREARDARGRALPARDGRIELRSLPERSCVSYAVDLDEARRASRFSDRYGTDVMTTAGAWLWRPPRIPRGGALLRFDLPAGVAAAVPWPREGDAYRLDVPAFRHASFTAIGRFAPRSFERRGARFEVARLGSGWRLDDAGVRRWLDGVIDGVSTVRGRFPVDRLLVVLVPVPGDGVGFGMVRRGGGHSIALMLGLGSTPERLLASWVPWHELSHLLLPPLPQRDAWLYEGVATYYQEVLAARAGVKSPSEAWEQIVAGFERGARGGGTGRPLAEEAEAMPRTHAYQHVDWSGAAFALEADVELRRRGSSLDRAVARLAPAWRHDRSTWSGRRVCGAWDRGLEPPLVGPLCARYASRAEFPDVAPLLARLGIAREGRRVVLRDAELAAIRDAITRAGP